MSHHHPPATDPAAINDPTPPSVLPAGTGTGTDINPTTPTQADDSIIPPSADIIPASPLPPDANQNNTPNNTPNNNPNNTSNTTPTKDPNQNNTPSNNPNQNNQANNNQSQNNQGNNNEFITNPKINPTDPPPTSQQPQPKQPNDQPKQPNDQPKQPKPPNDQPQQQPNDPTKQPNDLTKPPNELNKANSVNSTANQALITNSTATSNAATPPQQPQQTQQQQQQPPADPQLSHQPQSTPHHTQQNSNNSNNDSGTGTSVGTIMGILVAAVIGAIVLAGILAMIKRRKKSKDQSDYHPELFNEKSFGYHNDPDRQSLESQSAGLPINSGTNRPLKPRSDPLYGPRPPSIIERHQASPAVPAPIPSYQPGQIFNHSHHPPPPPPPQPFHLHRPKPPTYHSPYGDQSLAYANNPPMDPAPNCGAGQLNKNLNGHGMNYDQSQMSLPEQRGGINMIQSPIPYPPGAPGEQYPNYQTNNPPNISNTASYNQQQVDQLDFFGHPSPAATMVGSIPADWNSSKSFEKPFNTDHNPVAAPVVNVATGIALTNDQSGNKPAHLMVSNLQQSYLDCNDGASRDTGYEKKNLDNPIGMDEPRHHSISNLQQSYLDCQDRGSHELELKETEDAYGGTEVGEGIEMDNLGTNNINTTGIMHDKTREEGLDWKLASPKLSSPLGDFFDDRLLGLDHPTPDHSLDQDSGTGHFLYNERPKHSLKVINH